MEQYKDWSPTQFDIKGLSNHEYKDWYVLPVIKTRDSDTLELANWQSTLKELTEHTEHIAVLRFNHWACGWFKIIVVRPNTCAFSIAEDIERALLNYPVLDDVLFSELEHDNALTEIDNLKPYYITATASTIIEHLDNYDITEETIFNVAFEHGYIDIVDAFEDMTDTQVINYLNLHLKGNTKLVLNLLASKDISEMFEHWCVDYVVTNHRYDYDTIALTLEMLPRNERLQDALNCIVPENQLALNL